MKKLLLLLTLILNGCATHAVIDVPPQATAAVNRWQSTMFTYQINYAGPKPGTFTGGEMLPAVPLDQADLSWAAKLTLQDVSAFVARRIPGKVVGPNTPYKYKLVVDLKGRHKMGPVYADFQAFSTLLKDLVTLTFGSSNYEIVADFDVTYTLQNLQGQTMVTRSFSPKDRIEHQKGDFEMYESLTERSARLLEKHLAQTMDEFFGGLRG